MTNKIVYIVFILGFLSCATSQLKHKKSPGLFQVGYKVTDLTTSQGKKLTIAIWYPTLATAKPYTYGGPTKGYVALNAKPHSAKQWSLLVFSHGYGGGGLGSVFFTEHLAARGWIVAAPDHNDKFNAVRIRTGQQRFNRWGMMRYAKQISRSTPKDRHAYLYRLDEIKLVLNGILESKTFGKLIDQKKIAIGGHSFGGYTALGLCGTIPTRHDKRIKAILLFSSGAGGYLYTKSELSKVKMPSMYFLGERERKQKRGNTTMLELAHKVYNSFSTPKYLLEVKGGNHFSFNNRFNSRLFSRMLSGNEKEFELIRRYSIAFLEKYVAAKKGYESILKEQDSLLTRYLYK